MKRLERGIFLPENDEEFIGWCHGQHHGFIWNCYRDKARVIYPFMLHAALYKGDLCPHFRNATRSSGYEKNLTKGKYCKVCSGDRELINRWAHNVRPGFRLLSCSTCL